MVKVKFVLSDEHKRTDIHHILESGVDEVLELEIYCEKTGKSFSCPYVFNKVNEMNSEIHFTYCPHCGKRLVKKKEKVTLEV